MSARKRKWTSVSLGDNFSLQGGAEGFYCFEELTDYGDDDIRILKGTGKIGNYTSRTLHLIKAMKSICLAGEAADRPKKKKRKEKGKKEQEKSDELPLSDCVDEEQNVEETEPIQKMHVDEPSEFGENPETGERKKEGKTAKKERKKLKKKKKKNLKVKGKDEGKCSAEGNKLEDQEAVDKEGESHAELSATSFSKAGSATNDQMDDWIGLGAPDEVLSALSELKFKSPTAIQAAVLPAAIHYRQDIIGAAETGSGKTLAFGIPIIAHILRLKNELGTIDQKTKYSNSKGDERDGKNVDSVESEVASLNPAEEFAKPLYALVLTPTRELAIQVRDHIQKATKYTGVKCIAIVGGLAPAKQERLLQKCPEIVVGTPGRLYKLICDGQSHLNKLKSLKYLVIDEVDRMLEHGHFQDLSSILDLMQKSDEKRQCFLFSATVTIPQYHKRWKKQQQSNGKSEIQSLVDKIGLNPKAKVVDLTTKHVAAEHLKQKRVVCNENDKDLYLYYFLLTHTGRTLVFVNSIGASRRLCSILAILGLEPLQLHAGKQQRQRLKALDRFKEREKGLLVATDVAARGLDIPMIENVIHYHLPKDPKMYIHRSGRTARAAREGLSIIIEGPTDVDSYKRICQLMKTDGELESFSVDISFLPGLRKRIDLALKIDKAQHKFSKASADKNWYKRTAKEIETDANEFNFEDEDAKGESQMRLKMLKKELAYLLKLPLIPRGFSGSFPTKYGTLLQPGLPLSK